LTHKISTTNLLGSFLLTVCLLFSKNILAQEQVANEYRLMFVPTYAIGKDFFLTSYLGYVNDIDNETVSTYVGLPGLFVYKLEPDFQVQAGAFMIFNNDNSQPNKDNREFRFVIGEKFNLVNSYNIHLSNWTRYELRSFNFENNSLDKTNNRLRSRFAIEFPISKNPWQPKSWYGISDFEAFYTVEKVFFDKFRQRFGLGYIVDKQWTLDLVYHIQLDRSAKDLRPIWTTNIFRLDIRWTLPNRKHEPLKGTPDAD
jgi:hypothetical protein